MTASRLLHVSDTLRIEYFASAPGENTKLAFVFSSLGNRILGGNVSGGDHLIDNNFDVLSFSSISNDWFQTVPEAIFETIDEIVRIRGYQRRVAVGSSMGGYAAICFSKRLGCDIVLAYSPQYSVTDWFDGRFEEAGKKVVWTWRIGPDSIDEKCRYCFVYDNKDFDAVHAACLRALIAPDHVAEIVLPHAGHATVFYLYEIGRLKETTLKVLNGELVSARGLRTDRRRSRQYIKTLSDRLAVLHPHIAARVRKLAGPDYAPPPFLRATIERDIPLLSLLAEKLEIWRLRRLKFDEGFYRLINWDVEVSGADPLAHYVRTGRREGRLIRFRS